MAPKTSHADSLKQVSELYRAIKDVWSRAGSDEISGIVAAAVTNVASTSLREFGAQLRELDPAVSLTSLQRTCDVLQGLSSTEYEYEAGCEDQMESLKHMHASWKAVMLLKAGRGQQLSVTCIHKPADYVNSPHFVTLLIQGILHLTTSKASPDAIICNGTPLLYELSEVILHPENISNNLRSVFVLHLLEMSYNAYMSTLKNPNMLSGCRISALRLSQQAESALSGILSDEICFPCRCPETISFHLEQLRCTLQKYTAHKCWDIFFQAPFVAGNHILEILDMCFYYGMRLIRYRHYVGAVLHSYNVLKQLAALEEVSLLEQLCTKFNNIFFPGRQRPTTRFAASWARSIGARLKFKQGQKGHNHRENWCMAVPSHAAESAAGFGIGKKGKSRFSEDSGISKIMDLKRASYIVDDSTQNVILVHEEMEISKSSKRRSTGFRKSKEGTFFTSESTVTHENYLRELGSFLAQDLKGPLPSLRLNLFAVFETCIKIVSAISNAMHPDQRDKKCHCTCFVTNILSGGDRIKDNQAMGKLDCWNKSTGERVIVEETKKAIREVMANVKTEDWLWNI